MFPEYGGAMEMIVIAVAPIQPSCTWKALHAAVALEAAYGKVVVAIDDDVNPRDPESVWWAINYHCQPHRDFRITQGKAGLAPYSIGPGKEDGLYSATRPGHRGTSSVLIDATRKWPYPPISLPPKAIMKKAIELWKTLGLPELNLRRPWFGAPTARWSGELQEAADRAIEGNYETTGDQWARMRSRY